MEQLESKVESLLRGGVNVLASQVAAGVHIRELSKSKLGNLLDAHMGIMGVFGSIFERIQDKEFTADESGLKRIVTITSVVVGVNIVEQSISEGYYLQAGALVRQELESLGALEEIKRGTRKNGVTPKVTNVNWGLSCTYGDLSKAAHSSNHHFMAQFLSVGYKSCDEDIANISTNPSYNSDVAWNMYGLHIAILIQVCWHLNTHLEQAFGDSFTKTESIAFLNSIEILKASNWLQQNKP